MSFVYTLPMGVLMPLMLRVDPVLRLELVDRLRNAMTTEIADRLRPRSMVTAPDAALASAMRNDAIIFYGDEEEDRGLAQRELPSRETQTMAEHLQDPWRYPGRAENGLFADAVNRVVSKSEGMIQEYEQASRALRSTGS